MPYGVPGLLRTFPTGSTAGPTTAAGNAFANRGVFIGEGAGNTAGTSSLNPADDAIAIGFDAGRSNKANAVIAIGTRAARGVMDDATGCIAIGVDALGQAAWVNAVGADVAGTIAIGHQVLAATTHPGGTPTTAIGYRAMASVNSFDPQATLFRGNTVIGAQAVENTPMSAATPFTFNTIVGYQAAQNAPDNVQNSIAIGYRAMRSALSAVGGLVDSIAIGVNSMLVASNITHCIGIGTSSLVALTTGDFNVAIGGSALDTLSTGSHNTAVGYGAGNGGLGTGSDNVYVGYGTGTGQGAADQGNTYVGASAFMGGAGTKRRNVLIGHGGGRYTTLLGDYNLALEVTDADSPVSNANPLRSLIYGRFDLGSIVVGSTVDANGVPINRDVNATGTGRNLLKLLDGVAPNGNPVGGYFIFADPNGGGGAAPGLYVRGPAGTVTLVAPA